MNDLYRQNILDHYHSPHHWGLIGKASATAQKNNVVCGDALTVELDIQDEKIAGIRFAGQGCAISIAAASLLADSLEQKSVREIANLQLRNIEELLGTPLQPARVGCGLLGLQVTQAALGGK